MLVSVIVPVYNTEQYLPACLDSLLHQTIIDFEVIVVDDGSIDRSSIICDEYALKDDRFKVYHLSNGGVSNARNYGLSKAKGEYVTFVDSDDFVDNDYIEQLVNAIGVGADIVMSGIILFDESSAKLSSVTLDSRKYDLMHNGKDAFMVATMDTITSPVTKLYKKSIVEKHNVRFRQGQSYGEDREFNIDFLYRTSIVVTVSYVGYHYRRGVINSLSQVNDPQSHLDIDLRYIYKVKSFFDIKCVVGYSDRYIVNRLFHIFNDRISQMVMLKKLACSEIRAVLNTYKNVEQYKWMLSNIKYVDSNSYVAILYKLHLLRLLPYYYKVISL